MAFRVKATMGGEVLFDHSCRLDLPDLTGTPVELTIVDDQDRTWKMIGVMRIPGPQSDVSVELKTPVPPPRKHSGIRSGIRKSMIPKKMKG